MSKSLFIDPGHGGSDNGANGFGVNEKDWTLRISLYQYDRLSELGADVTIGRKTDVTQDSVSRTNAIKNKYDYCMSNHFNAFNGKARGVETIYSIYSDDEIAERIANAIVDESGLPLRRVFKRKGSRGDYYFMHRLTGSTTTIIVEYGFIDNKVDHDFYKDEDNFYAVAEAVVEVWCDILGVEYKAPNDEEPTKEQSQANETYTVQKDDTLSAIAKSHDTTVAVLAQINDLDDPNVIHVGQKIVLPDGVVSESKPKPKPKKESKPKANLTVDGSWGPDTTRALQAYLGTPVDGVISGQSRHSITEAIPSVSYGNGGSLVIKALQKKIGAKQDGRIGPNTVRKLQAYLGTEQDGVISRPSSLMVAELQRRLNRGNL